MFSDDKSTIPYPAYADMHSTSISLWMICPRLVQQHDIHSTMSLGSSRCEHDTTPSCPQNQALICFVMICPRFLIEQGDMHSTSCKLKAMLQFTKPSPTMLLCQIRGAKSEVGELAAMNNSNCKCPEPVTAHDL